MFFLFVTSSFAFQALIVTGVNAHDSMPTPIELSIAEDPEGLCKYSAQRPPPRMTSSNMSVCFWGSQRDEASGNRIQARVMKLAVLLDNGTVTLELSVRRVVILAPGAIITMAGKASVSIRSVQGALGINHNYNGNGLASEEAGNSSIIFRGQLNASFFEGQVIYHGVNRSHVVQCRHNNSLGPDFHLNDACLECLVSTYDSRHVSAFPGFLACEGRNFSSAYGDKGVVDGSHNHTQKIVKQRLQLDEDISGFPQTGISDYSRVSPDSHEHYKVLNDGTGLNEGKPYLYAESGEDIETPTRNLADTEKKPAQIGDAKTVSVEIEVRDTVDAVSARVTAPNLTALGVVTSVPNITAPDIVMSVPNVTASGAITYVPKVTTLDVVTSVPNVTAPGVATSVPNVTIQGVGTSVANVTVQSVVTSVPNVTAPNVVTSVPKVIAPDVTSVPKVIAPDVVTSVTNVTVSWVLASVPNVSTVPDLKMSYDGSTAAHEPDIADRHTNSTTTTPQSRKTRVHDAVGEGKTNLALGQSSHITQQPDRRRSRQSSKAVKPGNSFAQLLDARSRRMLPSETEQNHIPIQSRIGSVLQNISPSPKKRRSAKYMSVDSRKPNFPNEMPLVRPRESLRQINVQAHPSSENVKLSLANSNADSFIFDRSRRVNRFQNEKFSKMINRHPRPEIKYKRSVKRSFKLTPISGNSVQSRLGEKSRRPRRQVHSTSSRNKRSANRNFWRPLRLVHLMSYEPRRSAHQTSGRLGRSAYQTLRRPAFSIHKRSTNKYYWRPRRLAHLTFHQPRRTAQQTSWKLRRSAHTTLRRPKRPARQAAWKLNRPARQKSQQSTRPATYRTFRRHKRSADRRETVSCTLHLVADHLFFNEVGDSSAAKTVNLMLAVVIGADAVFRETDFDGDGVGDNIGFLVSNITIIQNSSAAFYGYSATNGNSFQYLRSFSTGDFSDVCLGVAFTAIDFERGVVGLAWYASSLQGRAGKGGICGRRVYLRNEEASFSFNTAIVSFRTHGVGVSMEKAILTMAHEFGHCFGSSHDDMAGSACNRQYPGGTYLMQKYRPSQYSPNNFLFSPCSLRQMYPVIALKGSCFTRYVGPTCGNGVLEEGEECDCGLSGACQFNDPCCTPGDESFTSLDPPCTVRRSQGFDCSPVAFPCCTAACKHVQEAGRYVCREKTDCYLRATCDGRGPFCPVSPLRPDGTLCAGGARVCKTGRCSQSLCIQAGLADCSCLDPAPDRCKLCCQLSPLSPCRPAADFNITGLAGAEVYLPEGDSCLNNRGQCTLKLSSTSTDNESHQYGSRQCSSIDSVDSDFSALIGLEAEFGEGAGRGGSLSAWLYLLLLLPLLPAFCLVIRHRTSRLELSFRILGGQSLTHPSQSRTTKLPTAPAAQAGLRLSSPPRMKLELGCPLATTINHMLEKQGGQQFHHPKQVKQEGSLSTYPALEQLVGRFPVANRAASQARRHHPLPRQAGQKGPPLAAPAHSVQVSQYGGLALPASPRFLQLVREARRQAWLCRQGAGRAGAACDRICCHLQNQAGHVTRHQNAPCISLSSRGSQHYTGTALTLTSPRYDRCVAPSDPSRLSTASSGFSPSKSSALRSDLYKQQHAVLTGSSLSRGLSPRSSTDRPFYEQSIARDSFTPSRHYGSLSTPSALRHSYNQPTPGVTMPPRDGACRVGEDCDPYSPSTSRGFHRMVPSELHSGVQKLAGVPSAPPSLGSRRETAGGSRVSHQRRGVHVMAAGTAGLRQ